MADLRPYEIYAIKYGDHHRLALHFIANGAALASTREHLHRHFYLLF